MSSAINWKTGFFRLWLVLSLLWVLAASLLAIDFLDWEETLYYDRATNTIVTCNEAPECWRGMSPSGDNERNLMVVAIADTQTKVVFLPGTNPSTMEQIAKRVLEQQWKRKIAASLPVVLFVVLPPLLLLLAGLTVAWILRGFRSATEEERR